MSDAPESLDAELPAGALVGSYELVERIGSGGMGDVYRARHKAIGKLAAVKVLKAERASDAKALELFLKEATTLGALSHRNLVEVLDFGHLPNGQPFLTMAFVDGKTLYQAVQESLDATGSGLTVPTALGITEQVLSALGEAHKKGIVHRDLKPANVMLVREHTGETLVKVLDFGLARATEGSILPWATTGSTQHSSAAGTPAYVSPEQVRNEELDGRADLYSLGCTLFEMLTGRAPFVADSPLELVKLQLDAEPP
ncbi:MAG: serine/threonine protein kinase, partial [Myxococcaceae bacterium]|nr:serine/threonine protein kinase [Myxococcaceae bacterium]